MGPWSCTQQKAKSLACSFHAFLCQPFIQHGMSSSVLSLLMALSGSHVCPKTSAERSQGWGLPWHIPWGLRAAPSVLLCPLECATEMGPPGSGLWGRAKVLAGWSHLRLLEIMEWLGGKGP